MIKLIFDETKVRSDVRFYIRVFKTVEDSNSSYAYELRIVEPEDKWSSERQSDFDKLIDVFLIIHNRILEWTRNK